MLLLLLMPEPLVGAAAPAEATPEFEARLLQSGSNRSDTLALTNVTVIDGTGTPPRPRMTVLVHGDMIGGVFPVDEAPIPASAEMLDLSGRYLVPGLINTHVHLPMLGWTRDSGATGLERMRNASRNPGAHAAGCTPDLMNASLRAAHRAGVRISTGTDYVIADGDPDPTLITEIEYLIDAGVLTPLEAITAATLNGARAIGIEDHYGTVEAGKVADFVVLGGDPTEDIGALRSVVAVFKEGRQVLRQ